MGRLDGKVAVITGAASGMGRVTAIRFAQEGAAVLVTDLNQQGGADTVAECKKAGARAVFQRVDVMNEADIKGAVDRAVNEFGKLDVMFNNAGLGGAIGGIESITVENWDRTHAILLRAVFLGMKHSVPAIRRAGGGSIISTASIAGLDGGAGPIAYSAAKAGVINLTKSVALEVGKDRIRVNCICPGGINTPLIFNNIPGGYEAAGQFLKSLQPIQRAGLPEDIAAMALFLASDESQWITGTAMVVDGGFTAGRTFFANAGSAMQVPSGFAGPSFEAPEWSGRKGK
ncbi:MAG: SDR family NAD(P)-dependent oxidoreductase [Candidatus Binataceae bacterium]